MEIMQIFTDLTNPLSKTVERFTTFEAVRKMKTLINIKDVKMHWNYSMTINLKCSNSGNVIQFDA